MNSRLIRCRLRRNRFTAMSRWSSCPAAESAGIDLHAAGRPRRAPDTGDLARPQCHRGNDEALEEGSVIDMHCPKCGQQQISEDTRFCSRCGLLSLELRRSSRMTELSGHPSQMLSARSIPQKRHQEGILHLPADANICSPFSYSSIAPDLRAFLPVIAIFLFGGGGFLRMVYALLFESGVGIPVAASKTFDARWSGESGCSSAGSVDSRVRLFITCGFVARYKRSPENARSVTDSTTKLLQKDDPNQ